MDIIQKQAKIIELIVGKQTVQERNRYRLLSFCMVTNYKDIHLLYNNLTKELLKISESEFNIIQGRSFSLSNLFVISLIEKWFLVDEKFDDILFSNQILNITKSMRQSAGVSFYDIVTTTACNAQCFYCFEKGIDPVSMSEQVAHDVANYMVNHYDGNRIVINWFGGEPLCNALAIDQICSDLSKNNINYLSRMTTNGLLFNDKVINEAISLWHLKNVQITLDGLEETYNKIKNYKSANNNPYQQVVKNIFALLKEGIAVKVRVNVDEYNIEEIYELVDQMADLFSDYKLFSLYAHLLFDETGDTNGHDIIQGTDSLAARFLKLIEYIDKLGLRKHGELNNDIKTYFCEADNQSAVLITPSGLSSRCEYYVLGDDSDVNVSTNLLPRKWDIYRKPIERCKTCAYYPTCLRLDNCPHCKHDCYEYEQKLHLIDLEKSIIAKYNSYISRDDV